MRVFIGHVWKFLVACTRRYMYLWRSVGRSVCRSAITLVLYRFFSHFLNCFYVQKSFKVHFQDLRTLFLLPAVSETFVHFWDLCIFFEILYQEHATYGYWPCFLVACTRLYSLVCRSVGWSVGQSVGRSVGRSVITLRFSMFYEFLVGFEHP